MSSRRNVWRGYLPRLPLLLALTLCFVVGCGSKTPTNAPALPVEGTLTWQDGSDAGELAGGTIEFEANGAVAAKADIVSDGTFQVTASLSAGPYRVRVVPPAGKPGAAMLDPKFQRFESSGLTLTGSSSPQHVRFKLIKRSSS